MHVNFVNHQRETSEILQKSFLEHVYGRRWSSYDDFIPLFNGLFLQLFFIQLFLIISIQFLSLEKVLDIVLTLQELNINNVIAETCKLSCKVINFRASCIGIANNYRVIGIVGIFDYSFNLLIYQR